MLPMQISENEIIKRLIISEASFLTLKEKTLLQKKLDSFNDIALMSNKELSSDIEHLSNKLQEIIDFTSFKEDDEDSSNTENGEEE